MDLKQKRILLDLLFVGVPSSGKTVLTWTGNKKDILGQLILTPLSSSVKFIHICLLFPKNTLNIEGGSLFNFTYPWNNHPYHETQGLVRKRAGHWTILRAVAKPAPDRKSNPIQSYRPSPQLLWACSPTWSWSPSCCSGHRSCAPPMCSSWPLPPPTSCSPWWSSCSWSPCSPHLPVWPADGSDLCQAVHPMLIATSLGSDVATLFTKSGLFYISHFSNSCRLLQRKAVNFRQICLWTRSWQTLSIVKIYFSFQLPLFLLPYFLDLLYLDFSGGNRGRVGQ